MKNRIFGIFFPENRGGAIFIFNNFLLCVHMQPWQFDATCKEFSIITLLLFVLTVHHLIEIDFM